jgi:hypothetical protein
MSFHCQCNFYETGKSPTALGARLDSNMESMYRRYTYFQENQNLFCRPVLHLILLNSEKKNREQAISNLCPYVKYGFYSTEFHKTHK